MKKLTSALLAALMLAGAGTATAANSLKMGTFGLNVGASGNDPVLNDAFIVQGKYFIGTDMALRAGAGIGIRGGDAEGTDIGFLAGIRKYVRVDDFAPFIGGFFAYSSTEDSNITATQVMAEFGAEYFLARQFSVEGSANFGYSRVEDDTRLPDYSASNFGTSSVGFSLNFYF